MKFNIKSDIYTPKDRTVDYVKLGDIFESLPKGTEFSGLTKKKKYRVFGVYPYHVSAIGEDGEIRSFCIGELVKLGLEPSGGNNSDTKEAIGLNDYD